MPKPYPAPAPTAQCQEFAALLPLLEKPETDAHARAQVQAHLATCAYCRAQQRVYRQMEADVRRTLSPAASAPRNRAEDLLRELVGEQSTTAAEAAAPTLRVRSTMWHEPTTSRRVLAGLGSFAAVLVIVALSTVLFANSIGMARPGYPVTLGPSRSHIIPSPISTMGVPATPVSTPGPASKYVTSAITATYVTNTGDPVRPTTTFSVGAYVYVVVLARNIPNMQSHIISVRWFYDGVYLSIPNAKTSLTVNGDYNVVFALTYGNPGVGMAKIYFDRPPSDTSDSPNDPSLAQTISFAIVQPTGTVTPGAGTPGMQAPNASIAAPPVAWRSSLVPE